MRATRRRRAVLAVLLLAAGTVPAAGGWTAYRGLSVRDHLQASRDALLHLRAVISARDAARITATLASARWHAAEAERLTAGADWSLITHAPVVGYGATTVRDLAAGAAELTDVLTGLQGAAAPLIQAATHSTADVRRALAGLHAAAPALGAAVTRLDRVRARLSTGSAPTGLDSLDRARESALRETVRLRGWLHAAATAATLVPPMLGHDGPRRYFLAFQTNAEARGTGGLVGAFGILEAAGGRVAVERLAANNDLEGSMRPVADHGTPFRRRYGEGAVKLLSVSNLSPHFPYAATTWTALWERQTGRRLDGAVAIDPVGLSYLLGATGPVTLPGGEKVDAANVVDLTERAAYARYADPAERKRYLLRIAAAVSARIPDLVATPSRLLPVLSPMIEDRRIQVWSRRDAEQDRLARTPLGGVLPERAGPYAGLVVNNAAGGKLDFYLDRSLDYELGPCRAGRRATTVRVRLANQVPEGTLPPYVTGRHDRHGKGQAPGANLLWVSLYAAVGAKVTETRLDGQPTGVTGESERSHPVYSTLLQIGPRQARTLEFRLDEPASAEPPAVPAQPLARPQHTRVSDDRRGCGPGTAAE
ncbi:DUF4012 domain-containing protein [Sphaerisporangium sp. TRM90804]|uniref:DUF4012 domain-containing protein n=1 Tax=Sphaerisporangium sp. TRM90804 TaxID=3031113 RepID=UPI00244A3A90|nr:DUF4012 domain-containing protein [Sphaerisporangium sp. TRM90804]MDH2424143.1 DUF4012 domain-containing protein [Sphaerisporangium sp. TRM90804]